MHLRDSINFAVRAATFFSIVLLNCSVGQAQPVPQSESLVGRTFQYENKCFQVVSEVYATRSGIDLLGKAQLTANIMTGVMEEAGKSMQQAGIASIGFIPLIPMGAFGLSLGVGVALIMLAVDVVGKTPVAVYAAYKECGSKP